VKKVRKVRSLFASILAISTGAIAIVPVTNAISPLRAEVMTTANAPSAPPFLMAEKVNTTAYSLRERSLNLAKRLPAKAIGLAVMDLKSESWQQLPIASSLFTSPLTALDAIFKSFYGASTISITEDLQSWIGDEVAIAVLGMAENQQDLLLAVLAPVVNDGQFEQFVQKVGKVNGSPAMETTYKKIVIREWELVKSEPDPAVKSGSSANPEKSKQVPAKQDVDAATNESQLEEDSAEALEENENNENMEAPIPKLFFKRVAIAKLPNGMAVVASDAAAVKQIIDVVRSGNRANSLDKEPLFLRSLNNPLWDRSLLAGYGSYEGLGKISEFLAADLPEEPIIPGFGRSEYLKGLAQTVSEYSSFDLFTWVTPTGIRSQSSSYFAKVRPPIARDFTPRDRLLNLLPANAYGSISSRNLNQQWQWLVKETEVQPTYKVFVEGLRMLVPMIVGAGFDLDIEKDIIAWMDGEYAISVFPSDRSPLQTIGADAAFSILARTSKPDQAKAFIAKLTASVEKMGAGSIQITKRQVGAVLLTSIEAPDEKEAGKNISIFSYGWRDPQTLIITLGTEVAKDLLPKPEASLADAEMFKEAITDMPQPNMGYFYLNARAIAKVAASFLLQELPTGASPKQLEELPPMFQQTIERIGGLSVVYSETSDRLQADFFLGLK
jgi:hypothetical protein